MTSTPATAAPAPAPAVLERLRGAVAARPVPLGRARPWRALVAGCLAAAALSLLLPSVPTYDPWAWIIWGREVAHLDLVTLEGPSWKPLPIFFTAPFSVFGDDAAPALWIVVARAGGILAVAMAYRLAARLAGPAAGVIAAATLLLQDEFIRNFARGNSEGLLVAICLWALERHLDGRRRDAFVLGFAAGLLRPEVWPFWGLYGLWLIALAWHARRPPWRMIALVGGAGAVLLALWFVPEYIGSGSALRAAERARQPNPDSAAFAVHPFLEVFNRSQYLLTLPVYVGGLLAVAAALRNRLSDPRAGVVLMLAGVSTALMVAVALMTEGGFAGNLRYVALPAAVVCILAGAGWVILVRAAGARWGRAAAAGLAAAALAWFASYAAGDVRQLHEDAHLIAQEAHFYGSSLKAAIAKAGGEDRIKACGEVVTGAFQTQAVTWYLHLHMPDVVIFPMPPGLALAPRYSALSHDPRYPQLTETQRWVVGSTCKRG